MLTEEKLKSMEGGEIIDTGVTIDNYTGINMSNSDKVLRWVAVRGRGYWDWAIYIQLDTWSVDAVVNHGDKVNTKEYIQRLVPCDEEALKLYRR